MHGCLGNCNPLDEKWLENMNTPRAPGHLGTWAQSASRASDGSETSAFGSNKRGAKLVCQATTDITTTMSTHLFA
jgi:hypothetical protein